MRQACARFVTWFTLTRLTATIAIVVTVLVGSDFHADFWRNAVRDYGLILACWGGVIAVWRGEIATRQADEQRKAVNAQREAIDSQREATAQSDLAHRQSLSQTRLFQAVELLKDESEPVNIAGARIVAQMPHDADNPQKGDALRVLEEFVLLRSSAAAKGENVDPLVQAAVRTLTEKKLPDGLTLDLHRGNQLHAHLNGAHLIGAHLEGAKLVEARLNLASLHETHLERAKLSRAQLVKACLYRARLTESDLSYANLEEADLSDAQINGANLTTANFRNAQGLLQEQLDTACQHPDGSPPLNLRDGLIWDDEAAIAQWREVHGPQVHG